MTDYIIPEVTLEEGAHAALGWVTTTGGQP